jgi:glycosyl hydrolase family 20
MTEAYAFRGVQMDLARQMEPVQEIKKFIDIIATNGYNTLFLYLEGRVRTKSYPYPANHECYTPEEMRDIVEYAAGKNIDVVPGLACLGHAELFLAHEELHETSELRDGRNGRFWNNHKMVFCPSQQTTKDFLENYLTEICEIFPTKYIHIGLDEAWEIGYCEKCTPKAKDFRGEQQLFLDMINLCRNIITIKFGRRVMMWDDMFEYYNDILPEVPRDVIMVCWQYQTDVRFIKGHFNNISCKHLLAEYNQLGFDVVIAPSDYSTANIRTLHEYAKPFRPMGMLVSSWEKKHSFRLKSTPVIAYGGRLCSADREKDDELFAGVVKDLFGSDNELLIKAVHTFSEQRLLKENVISLDSILAVPHLGLDLGANKSLELEKAVLESVLPEVKTSQGKQIIIDMLLSIEFHLLLFRLKKCALTLFNPAFENNNVEQELQTIGDGFEKLRQQRVNEWDMFRKGIEPCNYDNMYRENIELAESLPELAQTHGVLMLRYCLPDKFSAEHCRISLKYAGEWQEVKAGVFKNFDNDEVFWNTYVLIEKDREPEAVRIECKGYGGQGLAYVEAYNAAGHFTPGEILETSGAIITPEYVLDNDCKWCFIGEKDTIKAFRNRKIAEEIHFVEYKLQKG